MRVSNGVLRLEVEQHHQPGMHLGRHLELDARSLAYVAEEAKAPIKPAEWLAPIPTLDQGQLGSCTGNAGTRHLAQLYGSDVASIGLDGLNLGNDAATDEKFAVEVYHLATIADGFRGQYPPDDTGSSGLGVCRALKAKSLISGYHWATTARQFATLLQHASCIIGMPWLNAFFKPDASGFIDADPNWDQSGVAGGHEVCVEALEAWSDSDPSQCIIRVHNSWGDGWGDRGCFRMRLSTYEALKSQIDIKQFAR